MLLLADAGSTKTHWHLCHRDALAGHWQTTGINPSTLATAEIVERLKQELPAPLLAHSADIAEIHFFGAGCGSPRAQNALADILNIFFPNAHSIEVRSDLWAAIRATCGHQAGICAIVGTGTNSCVFDGKQIVEQLPSLGYLLGDEGSGGDLGGRLVRDFFYHKMPSELAFSFSEEYALSRDTLVEQLYQRPAPNAYLARFVPFLHRHQSHPYVSDLLESAFSSFFQTHITGYTKYADLPISLVGGVAAAFSEHWKQLFCKKNRNLQKILPSPFPELLNFYIKTY